MNKTTRILIVVAVVTVAVLAYVAKEHKSAPPSDAAESTATEQAAAATNTSATVTARLPRLLDLGAGKCVPCKMMKPILDDLKANYADHFVTEFIDVWENREAGEHYNIEMIPTQIFYDAEGKELFRHTGFFGKEDILGKWKELGVALTETDENESNPSNERNTP